MKRVGGLLLLSILSSTVTAQKLTPPDYTKAEVIAATQFCLEAFREQETNARRFPMGEFEMPVFSNDDVLDKFIGCVLDRLENSDAEVVSLT